MLVSISPVQNQYGQGAAAFLNGTNSPLIRLFITQLILIAALILVGLNLRV
ncbi:hypothetical protein ACQVPX_24960 [Bacillus toyonensis]|uniref:hypothetical protein n=1 Tax=Bacillus toyonensis TaxID=155322 RepID=UPI001F61D71F|nr:hypothetical protein [Bacillus toyonensis]